MAREPIQPQDKYVLRMPDGMRDGLKVAASENGRSLNAEIVARLEKSLDVEFYTRSLIAANAEIVRLENELDKASVERAEMRAVIQQLEQGSRTVLDRLDEKLDILLMQLTSAGDK